MLSTYFDIKIRPSVEKLEKTLGVRKQIEVTQVSETFYVQTHAFTCWDCGKLNNYWYRLCADCDAKLDSLEQG